MPAVPGENLLTTLFADVHYYFQEASVKPRHHRFDRGSYVYIYHNATSNQAKIEVANHAGTADQDAVSGYLGSSAARVQYSHKQPTLFTLTIPSSTSPDSSQWHLPTFDPHNEQKYLYRIHQIDIYLWTEKDAAQFLRHVKSVLSSDRLDVRDVPANLVHDEHQGSMSHVVQQLEKTAIGSQFPARTESAVSQLSFPGPPTPAASGGAASPQPPAAVGGYNPAAPAAPEPISYREKTPPPPDDGSGTGLKAAAKYESIPQNQPYQGYQSAAPQRQSIYSGIPPPPLGGTHGHQSQHSLSFSGPPSSQHTPQPTTSAMASPPPPPGPPPPQQQSFQSSFLPTQTQYANYPQQSFGPSIQSPGLPPTPSAPPAYAGHTPLQSPGLPPPPSSAPPQQFQQQSYHQQQQQQQQQQTNQYGFQQQQQLQNLQYSNYDYSSSQSQQHQPTLNSQGSYTGNIHAQAYRPTAVEATHGYHHHGVGSAASVPVVQAPQGAQAGEKQPKLSQLDKKVGGFLKRLDKMI